MDERRLNCSSSNKTNNHHEEDRFGDRHERQKTSRLLLCALCISIALVLPQLTSAREHRRAEHRRDEHRRAESDVKRDEPMKTDRGKAEGGKAEGGKAEGGKAEGGKAEGGKAEGGKAEGAKTEGAKTEGGKTEGAKKGEGEKGEGAKKEGEKAEGAKKGEGEKGEGAKKEGEKGEGAKKEGEKDEGEKGEGAKPEGEKPEGEKAEGANNGTASNETLNNEGNETATNETIPEETNGNETATNETGTTGVCPNHCWEKAATSQDVTFEDGVHRPEITNETGCKAACTNNATCTGSLWGFHANSSTITCFLQILNDGSSGSLSNADQWTFNNCSDDCFPYCWEEKVENVQTQGGLFKTDVASEEQCKSLCTEDHLCDGADWNPANASCWLLYNHKRTEDPVNHWEIVRNLSTSCTKSDEQCTPRCWNKTHVAELTAKDALAIKEESDSEAGCKELCGNNQTCLGVYWGGGGGGGGEGNSSGSNGSCFFQMPFEGASESMQNVTHWILSNCTDDCLPYCWLPKFEHIQMGGGDLQTVKFGENECKLLCSTDQKCSGVDWNATETSCWILHQIPLQINPTSDPVHHWEIEKNLPMVCNPEAGEPAGGGEPGGGGGGGEGEGEKPAAEPAAEAETEAPVTAENTTESNNETSNEPPSEDEEPGESGEPEVGESAVTTERPLVCPNYMIGIITMSAMAAVCLLIIICLIAFIISRTVSEEARSGGYESVPG